MVFAGDSIGRNQWESLLCMLAQAVSNKSRIYEVNGNPITKQKGFLSMRFHHYSLAVEYNRAPFSGYHLGTPQVKFESPFGLMSCTGTQNGCSGFSCRALVERRLRSWAAISRKEAKINMIMSMMEAFRKSLQTWKSWALRNLDLERSQILP
ncbi:protein trichome birefringence-like 8 [Juglans microcarpa x Juglans regia]|uniref:protein trichome birefringence-like 8 n=1 Tax=Juglans microcarpa x Juglans regia TaxID=2249226 RepID=UPI001B7D9131|nr:protein trichome birefringence-like 8 [Juglans microcarpa x Juglans regia]